ncbi:hypothetical protein F4808DRAFT_467413 [Astrocystis sublimbata]|nr:hypothetical protein F4808DRAFT_467413 [Astrocystis sublimbata]
MASHLESLPLELIHMIVKRLPSKSLAALRLTSHTLALKASYGEFAQKFNPLIIKLDRKRLEDLVQLSASKSYLLRHQKHITITGLVGVRKPARAPELIKLLTELFTNFKEQSETGCIPSLTLRVMFRNDIPRRLWWHPFDMARQTFIVTMSALTQSGLCVSDHIDLFTDGRSYSLQYKAFLRLTQRSQQDSCSGIFQNLKKLSVNLSSNPRKMSITKQCLLSEPFDPDPDDPNGPLGADITPQNRKRETRHVGMLLQEIPGLSTVMPQLENLDLRWRNIGRLGKDPPEKPTGPQASATDSQSLTLAQSSLRGIITSDSDLIKFIGRTNTKMLEMDHVMLVTGADVDSTLVDEFYHIALRSVFKYINSPEAPVTHCQFQWLLEDRQIMWFTKDDGLKCEDYDAGHTPLSSKVFPKIETSKQVEEDLLSYPLQCLIEPGEGLDLMRRLMFLEYGPPLRWWLGPQRASKRSISRTCRWFFGRGPYELPPQRYFYHYEIPQDRDVSRSDFQDMTFCPWDGEEK